MKYNGDICLVGEYDEGGLGVGCPSKDLKKDHVLRELGEGQEAVRKCF